MIEPIETTLDSFERGRISRREALTRLTALMLAIGSAGKLAFAEEPAGSTFEAKGLDHIALRVTDVSRSRDFYAKHLGLRVTSQSDYNCFMSCGEDFVALFRSDKPGLDHYSYAIDDYDPARAVTRLENANLKPRRHENRVYFDDPDGLTVQVSGR